MSDSPTSEGKLYKQAPEVHVKAMQINSLTVSKTTVKLANKQVLGYNVPIHKDSLNPMKEELIKYEEGGWGRKEDITFLEPKFPFIQFFYKQVLLYVAKQTHLC